MMPEQENSSIMAPPKSMSDGNRSDNEDTEKTPPPFVEDVLRSTESPLARTPTTPPAPLTEIEKGLIAWDSPSDTQNPL
jgi:hypothetical protein